MLLQEFDFEVKYRRGCENQAVDHLIGLSKEFELDINYSFPDKQVLAATLDLIPWITDFANCLVSELMAEGL